MNGVYRLTSLDLDGPDQELDPLGDLVGEADLVGLGESVHTSGGFYRAKHRVFAYLVRRHGFRALAIESDWRDAERIGRYLATGQGDPVEVTTQGLYPVWACAETVELVRWMREWNVEHPDDPLSLFGFDASWPGATGTAPTTIQAREDGMAHTLKAMRERRAGGRKTAVWAHNGHLAHATHRAGLRGYWMGAVRGMGTLLRAELGARYRAVALTGSRVATRWPGKDVAPHHGPDTRRHSFDRRVHRSGSRYAIVDPATAEPARGLFGRPRKEWFGRPDQVRIVVREQFAAVLYLDESPAMTPL